MSFDDMDVISVYTLAQAVEDGVSLRLARDW